MGSEASEEWHDGGLRGDDDGAVENRLVCAILDSLCIEANFRGWMCVCVLECNIRKNAGSTRPSLSEEI